MKATRSLHGAEKVLLGELCESLAVIAKANRFLAHGRAVSGFGPWVHRFEGIEIEMIAVPFGRSGGGSGIPPCQSRITQENE